MSHSIRSSAAPRSVARLIAATTSVSVGVVGLLATVTFLGGPAASARVPELTTLAESASAATAGSDGIWPASTVPEVPAVRSTARTKLGVVFSSTESGRIAGVQFYRGDASTGRFKAQLWTRSGKRLASVTVRSTAGPGWETVRFDRAVRIQAGKRYTAAYVAPQGRYARDKWSLGGTHTVTTGPLTAHRGTFGYGKGRPTESHQRSHYFVDVLFRARTDTTTPPPVDGFPGPEDTGVPDGVRLGTYTATRTITTAGTVIDAQTVPGSLSIQAKNVTISRSSVQGNITIASSGSLTITDSLVDGGTFNGSAVGQHNITMRRTEVIGARQSVSCINNCDIQDSWLHDQYILPGSSWHGDGFTSNGGSNVLLRHNTLACDSKPTGAGGACSAALASYGDFAPISNHTYDHNLFVSSPAGYCMYAGYDPRKPYGDDATNVRVTDNVFQRGSSGKCGVFGAVTAVAPAGSGNVFSGNVWDDGSSL